MLKMTFNFTTVANLFDENSIETPDRGTDMPAANHGLTLPSPPGSVSLFCFRVRKVWDNCWCLAVCTHYFNNYLICLLFNALCSL